MLKENENELKKIEEINMADTTIILSQFTDTVLNIAQKAGLKQRGKKTPKHKNDPLWYDKECRIAKNKLRELSNIIRKQPHNNVVREKLFSEKRNFKKLIKTKKRKFKEDIIKDLALNKKNSKHHFEMCLI